MKLFKEKLSRPAVLIPLSVLFLFIMISFSTQRLFKRESTYLLPSRFVGVYSPINVVKPYTGVNTSIGFFDLSDPKTPQRISDFLEDSKAQRVIPIISLEPFRFQHRTSTNESLLEQYQSAEAILILQQIHEIFTGRTSPVIVRLAHEMDVPDQYPWYFANPYHYHLFYRHIYRLLNGYSAYPLLWLWSPQGRPYSAKYWPGEAFVDLIGISVFSSASWSPEDELQSFSSIVSSKSWLSRYFKRPLFAAEIGVSATPNIQSQWISDATKWILDNPDLLIGIIYYQSKQPDFMVEKTGFFDWRITDYSLNKALNLLTP